MITVNDPVKVVAENPDDDIILSTAVQGNSNYIVSGDKHLLHLGEFKGIKIVTVKMMLEILSRNPDV